MKTLVVLMFAAMLTACATPVPVKQTWPEVPKALTESCPDLKQLSKEQGTLRDLLSVVIENYALYYACASRTQGWQEWYQEQKKIQEQANK
jgi:hypothetical protein